MNRIHSEHNRSKLLGVLEVSVLRKRKDSGSSWGTRNVRVRVAIVTRLS